MKFSEKKPPHEFRRGKLEKTSELFFRARSRSWVVNVAVGLFMSLEQEQWVDPAPLFLQS